MLLEGTHDKEGFHVQHNETGPGSIFKESNASKTSGQDYDFGYYIGLRNQQDGPVWRMQKERCRGKRPMIHGRKASCRFLKQFWKTSRLFSMHTILSAGNRLKIICFIWPMICWKQLWKRKQPECRFGRNRKNLSQIFTNIVLWESCWTGSNRAWRRTTVKL